MTKAEFDNIQRESYEAMRESYIERQGHITPADDVAISNVAYESAVKELINQAVGASRDAEHSYYWVERDIKSGNLEPYFSTTN